jgi:hypothetical protein
VACVACGDRDDDDYQLLFSGTEPCETLRLLGRAYGISIEEETTGE